MMIHFKFLKFRLIFEAFYPAVKLVKNVIVSLEKNALTSI